MSDDDFLKRFRKVPPPDFDQKLFAHLKAIDKEQEMITTIAPRDTRPLLRNMSVAALFLGMIVLFMILKPSPDKTVSLLVQAPTMTPTPENPCQPYIVQEGDTITGVARALDVSPADLRWLNDLPENPVLHLGQALLIPGTQCTINSDGEIVPAEPYCPAEFRPVVIAKRNLSGGEVITPGMVQLTCWADADNTYVDGLSDSVTLIGFDDYAVLFDSLDAVLDLQLMGDVRQWSPILKTHVSRVKSVNSDGMITNSEPVASYSYTVEPNQETMIVTLHDAGFYNFQLGDMVEIVIQYLDTSLVADCLAGDDVTNRCRDRLQDALHREVIIGKIVFLNDYLGGGAVGVNVHQDEVDRLMWAELAEIPLQLEVVSPTVPRLRN